MYKQRYFLEIAYCGTAYHGWQVQANAHTVQAELNQALATIFRNPIETLGAGRTDTGVHARQLYVHFDLNEPLPNRFLYSLSYIAQVYQYRRVDFLRQNRSMVWS